MILNIIFAALSVLGWAATIVTSLALGHRIGLREGFTQGYAFGRHDGERGIPRTPVKTERGERS